MHSFGQWLPLCFTLPGNHIQLPRFRSRMNEQEIIHLNVWKRREIISPTIIPHHFKEVYVSKLKKTGAWANTACRGSTILTKIPAEDTSSWQFFSQYCFGTRTPVDVEIDDTFTTIEGTLFQFLNNSDSYAISFPCVVIKTGAPRTGVF